MAGVCWRAVEAQHRVSTMKLVDTLAEQSALESLIDATKPPVPPDCRHLHYLLATPFRYGAPYPTGSRFRRAGADAGGVLRVENGRDGCRGDDVPPPFVFRGLTADALAGGRRRLDGFLGAFPLGGGDRSDRTAVGRPACALDPPDGLRAMPGAGR